MTLALDTDVLVHWSMAGAPRHAAALRLVHDELDAGTRIALAPQTCWEFLHIATDARRFPRPLTMVQALERLRAWWDAPETARLEPDASVVHVVMELMARHGLGRKRILDTALAATLRVCGVRRLATFNPRDFIALGFIDVVVPGDDD